MYYLASPYTHESPLVVEDRVFFTKHAVKRLVDKGKHVVSPFVHMHDIACEYDLRTDYEFWEGYSKDLIHASQGIIVLQLNGYDTSVGVQKELAHARSLNLPVYWMPDIGRIDWRASSPILNVKSVVDFELLKPIQLNAYADCYEDWFPVPLISKDLIIADSTLKLIEMMAHRAKNYHCLVDNNGRLFMKKRKYNEVPA